MTLGVERPICEVLQLRPQPVYFAIMATRQHGALSLNCTSHNALL